MRLISGVDHNIRFPFPKYHGLHFLHQVFCCINLLKHPVSTNFTYPPTRCRTCLFINVTMVTTLADLYTYLNLFSQIWGINLNQLYQGSWNLEWLILHPYSSFVIPKQLAPLKYLNKYVIIRLWGKSLVSCW